MAESIGTPDVPTHRVGGRGGPIPPHEPPAHPGEQGPQHEPHIRYIGVTVRYNTLTRLFEKRKVTVDPPHPQWNRRKDRWENHPRFPWAN